VPGPSPTASVVSSHCAEQLTIVQARPLAAWHLILSIHEPDVSLAILPPPAWFAARDANSAQAVASSATILWLVDIVVPRGNSDEHNDIPTPL